MNKGTQRMKKNKTRKKKNDEGAHSSLYKINMVVVASVKEHLVTSTANNVV